MNNLERKNLINKVLKSYYLYEKNNSRIGRLIKTPLKTSWFYIMVFLAYIKPYRIYSKTLWGDKITYFLPEANQIHFYGYFEVNLTNFLINFLKPGNTFLDIGAHVGYYSMLASHLVESQGKIYSLEPTPKTFHSLQLNSQLAKNKNIFPFNLAALDKKTTIDFWDYGPKHSAFNTFQNRIEKKYNFLHKEEHQITVSATDLDSFCSKNKINPDFIKIDAEGAEYLILKGSLNMINTTRPLISIEVSLDEEWKKNRESCFKFFNDNDCQLYEISIDGLLSSMKNVVNKYDNLLAVPKEKIKFLQNLIKE